LNIVIREQTYPRKKRLDEISQVLAKEAGDIAYMLANGSGKNQAA
jgi:hypothetical protein